MQNILIKLYEAIIWKIKYSIASSAIEKSCKSLVARWAAHFSVISYSRREVQADFANYAEMLQTGKYSLTYKFSELLAIFTSFYDVCFPLPRAGSVGLVASAYHSSGHIVSFDICIFVLKIKFLNIPLLPEIKFKKKIWTIMDVSLDIVILTLQRFLWALLYSIKSRFKGFLM